jgi:hypothetical protein
MTKQKARGTYIEALFFKFHARPAEANYDTYGNTAFNVHPFDDLKLPQQLFSYNGMVH